MFLIYIGYCRLNSSALEERNVWLNFLDTIEFREELSATKLVCSIFGPLFIYRFHRNIKCLPDGRGLRLRAAHQHQRHEYSDCNEPHLNLLLLVLLNAARAR